MDAKLQTASDMKSDSEGLPSPSPCLLAFLAVTFIFNAYRLIDHPWILAFLAFAYSNLFLLYWCFDSLSKAPEDSQRREALMVAAWLLSLTFVLMLIFGFMLIVPVPLADKILLWSMAGVSVCFITYAFFLSHGSCNSKVAVGRKALEP